MEAEAIRAAARQEQLSDLIGFSLQSHRTSTYANPPRNARSRCAHEDRLCNPRRLASLFSDCAASGREGLARLAARRPDVLLVSLPLIDMSGVEFVRAASARLAKCQILLVAASGTEEELVAAIEAGAVGCVLEPCDAHELVRHALKLRAGGSPLSPLVARKLVERLHARTLAHAAAAALTARESDVVCLLANGLKLFADRRQARRVAQHRRKSHQECLPQA